MERWKGQRASTEEMHSVIRRMFQRSRIPLILLGLGGLGFWAHTVYNSQNSQKSHNSIFRGVRSHNTHDQILFHLKQSPQVQSLLGSNIHHDFKTHFIHGQANMFKGQASLEFEIEGDEGVGIVEFQGFRMPGETDLWESRRFTVSRNDLTIDLN